MNFIKPLNSSKKINEKPYKDQKTFEERQKEAKFIINKYPDRIPIICERVTGSTNVPPLDKSKFLVPKDLSIGQFMHVLRKRIELPPTTSIFLFCNNTIPSSSALVLSIYKELADPDGFLYIQFNGEDTFG